MLKKAKRMFVSKDKMRKPVERRKIRIELEATIDGSRTATLTVDVRITDSFTRNNRGRICEDFRFKDRKGN